VILREAIMGMENKVKELRDKIDEIDLKILDLIQSRANHASKIGEIKKESPDFDGTFYKPEREKEIIDRLTQRNEGPLKINNLRNIFKEIISACLSIEGELSISYLGPEGSFSDSAKKDHFGSSITSQSESTIEGIFKSVEMGASNFGIVPFENSSQGVINTTLNCLSDFNVQICGETIVNIEHHLASKKDIEFSQIKKVVSHPQALGQCSKWIDKNFGDISQVPMNSTAEAAKFVSNNDNCVAIVSDLAIEKVSITLSCKINSGFSR
jgi:chorismate mutase/prephenate dehydratase